ncbi:MAG TPA: twin-arginine translocation pathway signal [Xanthobacteraceae bacterium]
MPSKTEAAVTSFDRRGNAVGSRAGAPRTAAEFAKVAAAFALLVSLTGCSGLSEDAANAVFVAPGKFDVYTCADIGRRARSALTRELELQELMDRASQSPGGALVNELAYRNEYLQARAELKLLADTASGKNCTRESLWAGERAVW